MFNKFSNRVTSHPKAMVAIWIVLLMVGGYFATQLPAQLSAGGFNDPDSESMQAKSILQDEFANKYPQNLLVVVESDSFQLSDAAYKDKIEEISNEVSDVNYVEDVNTFYENSNSEYASDDNKTTFISVGLEATEDQAASIVPSVEKELENINEANFEWWVTGAPALNYALNDATKKEVTKAEMIAIPIMIIILLLVFRTVASTVLPLMMAMFALGSTMALCYFIAQEFTLNILITNIISMIGLGVIVDYALFIISRYKTELKHRDPQGAIIQTLKTSGRAVFYSGLTVAISLSALFIPNMMIFNSIAIGGVIVVTFAVLVSLTLLPAVLLLLGNKINWGKLPFYKESTDSSKWSAYTNKLMSKPVLFLLPTLAILLFFAWPSTQANMQVPVASASVLPDDSNAKKGFEVLTENFNQGDMFPVQVVIQSDKESLLTKQNLSTIDQVTKELNEINGVEKVSSITNWNEDMNLKDYQTLYESPENIPDDLYSQLTNLINLGDNSQTTEIMVASQYAADSKATHGVVEDVRTTLEKYEDSQLNVFVGGQTAIGVDFDKRVFKNLPLIIGSVFLISFLVLVASFKSIVLPLKAILLNSLVTLASVGVLVLFFQNGFSLESDPSKTINSITPVVLFAVLFGLSMDYEVIIISRIKELYDAGLSNTESISKGIADTAGLVNGAAAIMVSVFGAFALVDVKVVAELGLGLAFAIVVDALFVRTVFVPTLMKLLGRLNWYMPFKKKKKSEPIFERNSKVS